MAKKMEKRVKIKEIRFHVPDELYVRLKAIARKNKRSITTQAEWYIEKALKEETSDGITGKEKIGEGLVRQGKMSKKDVQGILRVQRDKYSYSRRFGEIAVEMGMLDQKTLDDYLDGKNLKQK
jgi:hypothetical protein